jgi:VWFA-related protein
MTRRKIAGVGKAARAIAAAFGVLGVLVVTGTPPESRALAQEQAFQFKSATELVNITATVSDASGRFVPGLQKEDFVVYEDDVLQTVTHFGAERVPVSLGIAIDTSESMAGEKMRAARAALDQFYRLLEREDEIFLYRFSDQPVLVQGWTSDRQVLSKALGRLTPSGATALYDAVAAALPMAEQGQHRKKALIVISDGNDNSSRTRPEDLKDSIRKSELLVYAIGVDGERERDSPARPPILRPPQFPMPRFPGRRGRGTWPLFDLEAAQGYPGSGGSTRPVRRSDRVNPAALRELTDHSGGRTEIVVETGALSRATAGIADELRQQYYLGYLAGGEKDGRWHSIRVEAKNGRYRVRARGGYIAD